MAEALRNALKLRDADESFEHFKARLPGKATWSPAVADRPSPHDASIARAARTQSFPAQEAGAAAAQPPQHRQAFDAAGQRPALPTALLAEIRARGEAVSRMPILELESPRKASPMEHFVTRAFNDFGVANTSLSRQASSSDSGIGSGADDAPDSDWEP